MSAKILKIVSMLFASLILTACSNQPIVKYVDKPYEVKVPTKCVVPDANCSFDRNTLTGVINSLLECIITMKRNEEVCK